MMPDARRNAAAVLDPPPSLAEILDAKAMGLSLIAYRDRQAGVLPPDERNADRLEKQEQAEVRKVFRAFGGRIYSLSQARASKQTPGLGDDFVIFPGRVSFWWESKRQRGGVISPHQQEFNALCNGCKHGSPHYIGGRKEAEDIVIALGIATRGEDGSLYPVKLPDAGEVCGILRGGQP